MAGIIAFKENVVREEKFVIFKKNAENYEVINGHRDPNDQDFYATREEAFEFFNQQDYAFQKINCVYRIVFTDHGVFAQEIED